MYFRKNLRDVYNFFANKIIYIRKKYLVYTLRYRLDLSDIEIL